MHKNTQLCFKTHFWTDKFVFSYNKPTSNTENQKFMLFSYVHPILLCSPLRCLLWTFKAVLTTVTCLKLLSCYLVTGWLTARVEKHRKIVPSEVASERASGCTHAVTVHPFFTVKHVCLLNLLSSLSAPRFCHSAGSRHRLFSLWFSLLITCLLRWCSVNTTAMWAAETENNGRSSSRVKRFQLC